MDKQVEPAVEHQGDEAQVAQLVKEVLAAPDSGGARDAMKTLHLEGGRAALGAARDLCAGALAKERCAGVRIAGQLGLPDRAFVDECCAMLLDMLGGETDPAVLREVGLSLGFLNYSKAIPALIKLKDHADAGVRYGVTMGLNCHEDPAAIEAQLELLRDPDETVRNWATFGVGTQIKADTPEIRDALAGNLDDTHHETRAEAIFGLAKRKDERSRDAITKELLSGSVGVLVLQAAAGLADAGHYPLLATLWNELEKRGWTEDDKMFQAELSNALMSCGPAIRSTRRGIEIVSKG